MADDHRAGAAGGSDDLHAASSEPAAAQGSYHQQPPIGCQPGAQVPGQHQAFSDGVQQLQGYGNSYLQYSGYPASFYGAPNQMYSQFYYPLSRSPCDAKPRPDNNGAPPKYEH